MKPRAIRLTVILVLGIVCASPIADAQPGKVRRIGYLTAGGSVEDSFRQALGQLGYVEGWNLVIEGRFA